MLTKLDLHLPTDLLLELIFWSKYGNLIPWVASFSNSLVMPLMSSSNHLQISWNAYKYELFLNVTSMLSFTSEFGSLTSDGFPRSLLFRKITKHRTNQIPLRDFASEIWKSEVLFDIEFVFCKAIWLEMPKAWLERDQSMQSLYLEFISRFGVRWGRQMRWHPQACSPYQSYCNCLRKNQHFKATQTHQYFRVWLIPLCTTLLAGLAVAVLDCLLSQL